MTRPHDTNPMTAASPQVDGSSRSERDPLVDFLRAGSILIVVLWHWCFTIVDWRDDGPHVSNPIASTPGLWALTWVLQVMPVFFLVAGWVDLASWRSSGERPGLLFKRRLGRLVPPAAAVIGATAVLWVLLALFVDDTAWLTRSALLVLSPLWFLAVMVLLILLTPVTARLHDRGGEVVLAGFAAAAVLVDLGRFVSGIGGWFPWLAFPVVWGFVHQAGYFWDTFTRWSARTGWAVFVVGVSGLVGLAGTGWYPASMVGVPGDRFSNVGPPTLAIVFLAVGQIGLVIALGDRLRRWLAGERPRGFSVWMNRYAMPIFLLHLPGFTLAYVFVTWVGINVPSLADWSWWVQRPMWFVLPALFTALLVRLFGPLLARTGAAASTSG